MMLPDCIRNFEGQKLLGQSGRFKRVKLQGSNVQKRTVMYGLKGLKVDCCPEGMKVDGPHEVK